MSLDTDIQLSNSSSQLLEAGCDGSTIDEDTEAVNTITIVDKTMSIMEDSPIPSGFFRQQIYGDQYPDERIPLPTYGHSLPRQSMITIDPVVRNITSKPSPSVFPANGYRELLLEHNSRTNPTSTINPIPSAFNLMNIRNSQKLSYPLETLPPQSPDLKIIRQNFPQTVDRKRPVWDKQPSEPNDNTNFYSLQDGLNLTMQIQNDENEDERAILTPNPRPQPSPRPLASQFSNYRPYNAIRRHSPESDHHSSYEMIPNPLENSRKLTSNVESERQSNQYKTILYVVPNSPADDQDPYKSNSWHPDHEANLEPHHRSYGQVNTRCPTNREQQNNISIAREISIPPCYGSRPSDARVPIEHDPYEQRPLGLVDSTTDLSKQPNRYDMNEKPHFETLPSPRQMAVTMPTNGYNTIPLRSVSPIAQPTTVRLARSDYNQVVVDIKPRQMNEVDKRQHVSQWIHAGTLGDTVSPQVGEPSESILEEEDQGDVVHPVLYDDLDGQELSHGVEQNLCLNSTSRLSEMCDPLSQSELNLGPQQSEDSWTPTVGRNSENPDIFETEMNHPGTPETVLTSNSVRSNVFINVVGRPSISRVKKLHEGRLVEPPAVYYAESELVPEIYRSTLSPERQSPERTITVKSNPTHMLLSEFGHKLPKGRSMTVSLNQKIVTPDVTPGTTRMLPERCHRPQVAPKPTSLEHFSTIQDKRALTTTGAEIRHLNSKVSSRISKPSFISCTFPRSSNSSSRGYLNKPDWLYGGNEYYLESARDTPVPNVRNLTAYFSDLIERQNDTNRSTSSTRSSGYSMIDPKRVDERHILSGNQTPFLLYHETEEERLHRLRAVENLRCRTALPATDYTSPLSHSWAKGSADSAPEDFYPYFRPQSATKY